MKTKTLLLILTFSVLALASPRQKTVAELQKEVSKTHGGKQGERYAELAEALVQQADQQFTAGQSVQAHATVQQVLDAASHAHDISISTGDKRKQVEIRLRETQRHLEQVKRTLALEDRGQLDDVENKIEQMRQDLLSSMFAPRKKKPKEKQ